MTPISSLTPTSGTGSPATAASSNATPPGTVNENMFLQLLVAQLQNQDPMNPPDGMQFVTELAQFQQVQQSLNTGQDVSAMRSDIEQYLSAASKTTGSGATTKS